MSNLSRLSKTSDGVKLIEASTELFPNVNEGEDCTGWEKTEEKNLENMSAIS